MSSYFERMRGNPDLLFNDDGTVRLPKFTSLAVAMARPSGCLTRQPTPGRARAVMEALADWRPELQMAIRPGRRPHGPELPPTSWAVYLVAPILGLGGCSES